MSTLTRQFALLVETADMAMGTLRANKMRSALTVLGVVIGVTSIVGMTSLIRGFDSSLRDSINTLGPKVIFVQRFGALSFSAGASFLEVIRRPVLTVDDGEAIKRLAPSIAMVDVWLGPAPPQPTQERVFYRGQRTRPAQVIGTTEQFVEINFGKMFAGRMFTAQEVTRRRPVAVIGYGPYQALFEPRAIDPIGKVVRLGSVEYTVIGVMDKRPSIGNFAMGQDDFTVIPYTAYRKQFGSEKIRTGPFGGVGGMIAVVPHDSVTREEAMRKAIGARRREILVQFLIEAVVLTSIGGLLGVVIGSAIGLLVNVISGFPVSLPWWSFALGLGFSASVGIFFGVLPAWRASRLDPIEALRYE
jgi:ABC-type antimicrobial peptide transport system permease subunit